MTSSKFKDFSSVGEREGPVLELEWEGFGWESKDFGVKRVPGEWEEEVVVGGEEKEGSTRPR